VQRLSCAHCSRTTLQREGGLHERSSSRGAHPASGRAVARTRRPYRPRVDPRNHARAVRTKQKSDLAGAGAPSAAIASAAAGELMSTPETKIGDIVVVERETQRQAHYQLGDGTSQFLCAISSDDYANSAVRERFLDFATELVLMRIRADGSDVMLVRRDPA